MGRLRGGARCGSLLLCLLAMCVRISAVVASEVVLEEAGGLDQRLDGSNTARHTHKGEISGAPVSNTDEAHGVVFDEQVDVVSSNDYKTWQSDKAKVAARAKLADASNTADEPLIEEVDVIPSNNYKTWQADASTRAKVTDTVNSDDALVEEVDVAPSNNYKTWQADAIKAAESKKPTHSDNTDEVLYAEDDVQATSGESDAFEPDQAMLLAAAGATTAVVIGALVTLRLCQRSRRQRYLVQHVQERLQKALIVDAVAERKALLSDAPACLLLSEVRVGWMVMLLDACCSMFAAGCRWCDRRACNVWPWPCIHVLLHCASGGCVCVQNESRALVLASSLADAHQDVKQLVSSAQAFLRNEVVAVPTPGGETMSLPRMHAAVASQRQQLRTLLGAPTDSEGDTQMLKSLGPLSAPLKAIVTSLQTDLDSIVREVSASVYQEAPYLHSLLGVLSVFSKPNQN